MGALVYDGESFTFDDRVLAHLKSTIVKKLRKGESFLTSWIKPTNEGGGRISIWLSPTSILIFKFAGGRSPAMNPTWLKVLEKTSNSPRGLVVLSESEAEAYAAEHFNGPAPEIRRE